MPQPPQRSDTQGCGSPVRALVALLWAPGRVRDTLAGGSGWVAGPRRAARGAGKQWEPLSYPHRDPQPNLCSLTGCRLLSSSQLLLPDSIRQGMSLGVNPADMAAVCGNGPDGRCVKGRTALSAPTTPRQLEKGLVVPNPAQVDAQSPSLVQPLFWALLTS